MKCIKIMTLYPHHYLLQHQFFTYFSQPTNSNNLTDKIYNKIYNEFFQEQFVLGKQFCLILGLAPAKKDEVVGMLCVSSCSCPASIMLISFCILLRRSCNAQVLVSCSRVRFLRISHLDCCANLRSHEYNYVNRSSVEPLLASSVRI